MRKKDNLWIISNNVLDGLKNDGIEPKLDNNWIEKKIKDIWNNPWIIDDIWDYLESAPTIEDLEKEVKKISETAAEALTKAELAYSETKKLQKQTAELLRQSQTIYEKNKNLEVTITNSQEKIKSIKSVVSLMNWLVIWWLLMMLIAFIWWIIQDCKFRHWIIDEWNKKIIQNENIITNFNDIISKEERVNQEYVDSKIESEINKIIIEYYKWELEKNDK